MTITPILWKYSSPEADLFPLKIRISDGDGRKNTRDYEPIGIKIRAKEWDNKKRRVVNRVNASDINLKISEILNGAERAIIGGATRKEVRKVIHKIINPKAGEKHVLHTPITYFDRYIQLCKDQKILHHKKKTPLSEAYIKSLGKTRNVLQSYVDNSFGGNASFDDINDEFYDGLLYYLRKEYKNEKTGVIGVNENTIGSDIKRMVTVFKKAKKDKLLHIDDFSWWVTVSEDVDNIALNEDEINLILKKDLSDFPHLENHRKRFLIAYNFLLRFGDSISVSEKNIYSEGGKHYFKMTTKKTREQVVIPIMPAVYDILVTSGFRAEKISNQSANECLKELALVCGINDPYTVTKFKDGERVETVYKRWQMVTTHITRRSAATNLHNAKVDLVSIMKFGGWRTLKQLLEYIKIDKIENAKNQENNPFFGLK